MSYASWHWVLLDTGVLQRVTAKEWTPFYFRNRPIPWLPRPIAHTVTIELELESRKPIALLNAHLHRIAVTPDGRKDEVASHVLMRPLLSAAEADAVRSLEDREIHEVAARNVSLWNPTTAQVYQLATAINDRACRLLIDPDDLSGRLKY